MNDLIPTLTFLACLAATFALVQACEWLRPKPEQRPGQSATSKEANK